MTKLHLASNVARPDDTYQLLIDLHAGLDDEASLRVNAKLILLLVNHIGDENVLREAVRIARQDVVAAAPVEALDAK